MISIGCTSALQSIIANTPVIELTHPTIRVSEHNRGYAHKFTPLFASDGAQLIQLINSIGSSDSANFVNLDTLSKYWYKCFSSSVADDFAALLSSYYSHSSKLYNQSLSLISHYSRIYSKAPLVVNPAKWVKPSFSSVRERVNRFLTIHRLESKPVVHKVADCLYLISPN